MLISLLEGCQEGGVKKGGTWKILRHSCINSGNAELCGQAPPVFGLILPINQQNLPFLPDLKGDF